MENHEAASASTSTRGLSGGSSRGRGRLNPTPRTERKSLEVFGGAPASTRYLPGAGVKFAGQSTVPEGEEHGDVATPLQRIEPPWATPPPTIPRKATPLAAPQPPAWLAPNPAPLPIAPLMVASPPPSPPSPPLPSPAPMPWEINLDIPEYKPKPVIGSDDTDPGPDPGPKTKSVIRHHRSSSDGLKPGALPDMADERQAAIEKLKKQAEEDAKLDLAKNLAIDGSRSPEKEALPDSVMADRAAEWGLVLKSDEATGKTQGVQTRKSGENRRSGDSNRR